MTIAADSLAALFASSTIFLFGYPLQEALRILGLSVLGIGLYVYVVGFAKPIAPVAVWVVIGIEIAWTVGSILLLASIGSTLSWIGVAFIIASALAVFSFMIFELIGLQSLLRSRPDATEDKKLKC